MTSRSLAYFCLPFCSSKSSAVRARFWTASTTRPRSVISRAMCCLYYVLCERKRSLFAADYADDTDKNPCAKLSLRMLPEKLYALPLEQQIGQFLFIGLPGTDLDAETRELIEEVQPGGIIIFGRNVASPAQLRSLLDGARELLPVPPMCGIDQEGGLVDRLRKIFTPMPAARTIRQHGDLAAARALGRVTGEVLRMLGFNLN